MSGEVRRVSLKKARGKAAEDLLKAEIERKLKEVFTAALEAIEIRFGTDFDGFKPLRAKILRVGNDAIRDLQDGIDTKYIVERQSERVDYDARKGTVEFKGGKNVGESR